MDDEKQAPQSPPPAAPKDEPSHVAVGIGVIGEAEEQPGSQQSGSQQSGDVAPGEDHHGQDGDRETLTAGEAQRSEALGSEQEQRLPAMAQNNASDIDKISGVVVQTRSDVGDQSDERIREVLRERLDQAGIDVTDDDVAELARQISGGDS